jgi:hypothetical protein
MSGDRETLAAGFALVTLAALFAPSASADEQMLKLNSGIPAGVCHPPMKVLVGAHAICLVPLSMCTAHGGHVGQDPNDTSGQPHCLDSDLVLNKK